MLKMMQNIHDRGYIKCPEVYVCVCVCVCVKTSKNANLCISEIIQTIELKFGVQVKQKCPFLRYNFH